ncbi:MAG: TIGR04283 family arsenosugar biosynthesis glycosyltransferase [Myxococcales bacterium]|nr:TIGR04283 family arsenosugar biosynthesis glycosyltransferase [Myxococcales bacterium]
MTTGNFHLRSQRNATAPPARAEEEAERSRLSVIVPTLNEAKRLPGLLTYLQRLNGLHEVVVSDGGSTDGTREFVVRWAPSRSTATDCHWPWQLRLVNAERGRAKQLNAGAQRAQGDVLFFIHADTLPPADAAYWVRRTLREPGVVAGAFRTWHVADAVLSRAAARQHSTSESREVESPWWLHLADVRSRYTGLPYGDQGLFLTRMQYERLGGFPDQPLMEDLEFSLRLRAHGVIRTAPSRMQVSGRRFEAHPLLDTCLVNAFPALYRLGVPARRLAEWYAHTR